MKINLDFQLEVEANILTCNSGGDSLLGLASQYCRGHGGQRTQMLVYKQVADHVWRFEKVKGGILL